MKNFLTLTMMAAVLFFMGCSDGNNDSENDTQSQGTKTQTTDTNTESQNQDDNSQEESVIKTEETDKDSESIEDSNILDIVTTTKFSMKVGESITLKASWDDDCYYTITSDSNNAISISGTTLTANAIGTATVKITSSVSSSRAGDCVITVTEEGFEGSVIENMLVGTWKCSGSSYSATIVFNSNMTGHIDATLSSKTTHDNDFTWSAYEGISSKYFTLAGTNISSLDGQHTLTSISSTKFVMNGRLAFGFPSTSTWYKQ